MAQRYTLEALARLDLHGLSNQLSSQISSYTDHVFNRLGRLTGPFFPDGWGNLQVVNYEADIKYMQRWPPEDLRVKLRVVEHGSKAGIPYTLIEGSFRTPCTGRIVAALPPEARTARFQLLLPQRLVPFSPNQPWACTSSSSVEDDPGEILPNPSRSAHQTVRQVIKDNCFQEMDWEGVKTSHQKPSQATGRYLHAQPSKQPSHVNMPQSYNDLPPFPLKQMLQQTLQADSLGAQCSESPHDRSHADPTPATSGSHTIINNPSNTSAASATQQPTLRSMQHEERPSMQPMSGLGPCDQRPACVVHLPATGDQGYGRRLRLGVPLLPEGICSLVLEGPYYGRRKPAAQRGSKLQRVSDLLVLGHATIYESICLLHWLQQMGFGPLGIAGLSMGGVHACMTAGLYPGAVACIPLLAPRSAAVAYCDGAMRAAMAWEPLLQDIDEKGADVASVVSEQGRAIGPIREALHAHAAAREMEALLRQAAGLPSTAEGSSPTNVDTYSAKSCTDGNQGGGRNGDGLGDDGCTGGVCNDRGSNGLAQRTEPACLAALAEELSQEAQALAQQCMEAGEDGMSTVTSPASHSRAASSISSQPDAGVTGTRATNASASSTSSSAPTWAAGQGKTPALRMHERIQSLPSELRAKLTQLSQLPAITTTLDLAMRFRLQLQFPPAASSLLLSTRAVTAALQRRLVRLQAADVALSQPATVAKLKRVLETYTDITRYPRPRRPDACVVVAARDDAYVSLDSVHALIDYYTVTAGESNREDARMRSSTGSSDGGNGSSSDVSNAAGSSSSGTGSRSTNDRSSSKDNTSSSSPDGSRLGPELRLVSGGHVSAFLMHQPAFRQAIRDSLARLVQPPASHAGPAGVDSKLSMHARAPASAGVQATPTAAGG